MVMIKTPLRLNYGRGGSPVKRDIIYSLGRQSIQRSCIISFSQILLLSGAVAPGKRGISFFLIGDSTRQG